MKFLLLGLSVLATRADTITDTTAQGSLRGALHVEDEAWYDRMLAFSIGSIPVPTAMPTPCSNEIENCPVPCWEVDPNNRPPTCADLNRPDCQTIPLPDGCPLCCPDICIDPNIEDCSPTPVPSQAPSDCAEVIEICPFDTCFLPMTDSSRPPSCAANDQCNRLPQPTGVGCTCCPDECTPENPMFTPSPDGSPPACSPTMMPSQAPSDCAEVIDICPFDSCFLPMTDSSRPPSCPANNQCNRLPQPSGCTCCPDECSPDNPMFSPSPDGSPPACSPTMMPSQAPSDCSEVIDICPYDTCFLPPSDSSRPPDCAANDQCNVLPQPTGIGCTCCPDECRHDNPMFSPSPDGSPPVCSPTVMPTSGPTRTIPTIDITDPPSPVPSPLPSQAPSDCAEVIDICPYDTCFLPMTDPSRPDSCAANDQCNRLPQPTGVGCTCCPDECTPENPMFTPSPDGSPPACSPTMMPSQAPSECAEVITTCPVDTCFLPLNDPFRPTSCSALGGGEGARCNMLPQPTNAGCDCCPDECSPDNPMFSPSPDGTPPVCSPTAMPSPGPTPLPSQMPSDCAEVITTCPDTCFLVDGSAGRPQDCSATAGAAQCDVLPQPNGCSCCPSECRSDNPMFSPSPDGSPPVCSPTAMPSPNPSPQPSPLPSPEPSACQEVLDLCPFENCFLPVGQGRPESCRTANPACNVLPFPQNAGCPVCCPDECSPDNPMFDNICTPTALPSVSPTPPPTPTPSQMPSDCAEVITTCPDTCFLVDGSAGRPQDCSATNSAAQCDVLPQPNGCSCCPSECRSDNPMFFPSPDGSPPVCSPTAMPSPIPTIDPTPPPTPTPSVPPTPDPTPRPTPCQDVLDQCPYDDCFLPNNDGNRPPNCRDTNAANICNVLPQPFGCPRCCPDECRRDNPMFDGTVCAPTVVPSPAPSPVPTEPASELPTTADCGIDVDINVQCSTSCEFDNCVERPFRMLMFYRGGGCQNTMFRRCPLRNPDPTPQLPNPDPCTCTKQELPCSQWNNKNFCTDFNPSTAQPCYDLNQFCANQGDKNPRPNCGPPPNTQDHAVWIEAYGKDGEAYFIGPVNVNGTYTMQTVNTRVQADTDIFTYEFGRGGKGRLLQQVRFHSSCSDELWLTDQFGSNQLIEFESFCTDDRCDSSCFGGRRVISLFQESIGDFQFSLRARTDDMAPVTISFFAALLTPISDQFPFFGNTTFQEFSDQVGRTIPPPVTVQPNFNLRLDDEYILAAVITGQRAGGSCDSFGQTQFSCQRVPRCSLVPNDCFCDPFLAPNGKSAAFPEDEDEDGEDTVASALDGFTRFFEEP